MNDINPGAMKEIRDSIDHEKIQVLCLNGVKIDVKEELHGSVQCKMDNFATNLRTIRAIWRIFMLKKVGSGILRPEVAFCRDIPSREKNPDSGDKNPRDIPKVKNPESRGFHENPEFRR